MATRDLYINLKPDSLTGAFVVSHKNGAPYIVPPANRQEQLALRLFFITPNPTGGANAPIYVSSDGGLTWQLNPIVPGNNAGYGTAGIFHTMPVDDELGMIDLEDRV